MISENNLPLSREMSNSQANPVQGETVVTSARISNILIYFLPNLKVFIYLKEAMAKKAFLDSRKK